MNSNNNNKAMVSSSQETTLLNLFSLSPSLSLSGPPPCLCFGSLSTHYSVTAPKMLECDKPASFWLRDHGRVGASRRRFLICNQLEMNSNVCLGSTIFACCTDGMFFILSKKEEEFKQMLVLLMVGKVMAAADTY